MLTTNWNEKWIFCILFFSNGNVCQCIHISSNRGGQILCHRVSIEITRDSKESERDYYRDLVGCHCNRTSRSLLLCVHGETMEKFRRKILHGSLAPSSTERWYVWPRKTIPRSLLDMFAGGPQLGPYGLNDGGIFCDIYKAEEKSKGVQDWKTINISRTAKIQEKGCWMSGELRNQCMMKCPYAFPQKS